MAAPARPGRVSLLVAGSIVLASAGLVAVVAWPALWWEVATSAAGPPAPPLVRLRPGRTVPPPPPGPPPTGPTDPRSEPVDKPLADIRAPAVRTNRKSAAGQRRTAAGLTVTEVRLTAGVPIVPIPPQGVGLYAGAVWAADGKSFCVLSTQGELRQITYPDLVQTRMTDLGHAARNLIGSAAGLLATLPGLQELWVIDPDTLDIRRRIGVTGARKPLTGPHLTVAYVLTLGPDRTSLPVRVDLTDGSQTGLVIRGGALAQTGGLDFRAAVLAPDGRALFAEAGAGLLVRYRIDDEALTLVDQTAPIVRGSKGYICVSPDGRWVCLPTPDGHAGADGGLHVYAAADLSRPAFTLRPTPGCFAVGFGPGERVCATTTDRPLVLFDAAGAPGPTVPPDVFPEGPHDVASFQPHPDGRGMLIVTTDAVYLVEFPS